MRPINFIYVEKMTAEELKNEKTKWINAGFEYVPFHFMISFSDVEADKGIEIVKGRPLSMNNGLIRDSFLSEKGLGFLLIFPENTKVTSEAYKALAKVIKNTIVDIGVNNYQLATNYYDDNRKLDIIKLHYEINDCKTDFLKLK